MACTAMATNRCVLPTPGGPQDQQIVHRIHPLQGEQLSHLMLIQGGLKAEIEIVQGLLKGQSCHLGMRPDLENRDFGRQKVR